MGEKKKTELTLWILKRKKKKKLACVAYYGVVPSGAEDLIQGNQGVMSQKIKMNTKMEHLLKETKLFLIKEWYHTIL